MVNETQVGLTAVAPAPYPANLTRTGDVKLVANEPLTRRVTSPRRSNTALKALGLVIVRSTFPTGSVGTVASWMRASYPPSKSKARTLKWVNSKDFTTTTGEIWVLRT